MEYVRMDIWRFQKLQFPFLKSYIQLCWIYVDLCCLYGSVVVDMDHIGLMNGPHELGIRTRGESMGEAPCSRARGRAGKLRRAARPRTTGSLTFSRKTYRLLCLCVYMIRGLWSPPPPPSQGVGVGFPVMRGMMFTRNNRNKSTNKTMFHLRRFKWICFKRP